MKLDNNNKKSLGEMLREARLAKNITIEELGSTTKIHKRLIQTLESDDLINLPNRVYVLGFLKSMSEELRFNLKEAVNLYEIHLWKNKQGLPPEEKKETSIPDKIVTFHLPMFFKQKRKIKAKWLVAGVLCFVFFIIISPLLLEVEVKEPKKMEVTAKVAVKNTKPKMQAKNTERKIAYAQGSQKVSINAKNGNTWISFKVDKNPARQLTLKKGSSIILSGEKVRLTLGNHKAVEITNNSIVVNRFRTNKNKTTSVTFPQQTPEKKNESKFIFSHDGTQSQNSRLPRL